MSEKLEQVARALADLKRRGDLTGTVTVFDEARAAIAAMREPTEAMLAAVEAEEERLGYCSAAFETMGAKDSWPIMVDAVLK